MEKFIIRKNEKGEFEFDFLDKKQMTILSSNRTFAKKSLCLKGIDSVKRSSQDKSKFNIKRSPNDEPYFNLKSFNGIIIGVSQVFEDKKSRNNAIEILKTKALEAVIEDWTEYLN